MVKIQLIPELIPFPKKAAYLFPKRVHLFSEKGAPFLRNSRQHFSPSGEGAGGVLRIERQRSYNRRFL